LTHGVALCALLAGDSILHESAAFVVHRGGNSFAFAQLPHGNIGYLSIQNT
jgi:hypothetical protein